MAAAVALRFWQGTSTRPPTGSHTSPMSEESAFAAASRACAGVPPAISTAAAAAMAAAAPISAWQPPSAPDTVALRAMRYPTAPAASSPRRSAAASRPRSCSRASSTPGTTPAEPAVGAATMRPMDAFVSSTASAYSMAAPARPSTTAGPCSRERRTSRASPPMSPPMEGTGSRRGSVAEARMTASTRSA